MYSARVAEAYKMGASSEKQLGGVSTDPTEAFFRMLSYTCPQSEEGDGTKVFVFDLCCLGFRVRARVIEHVYGEGENYLYSRYEILSAEPRF